MGKFRVKRGMSSPQFDRGTIYFTLWGIPVRIQPSLWITLALLGGVINVSDGWQLLQVIIFMLSGLLTLLAHEFGHALTGRYFTGQRPEITLALMGGETELPEPPRTRAHYIFYVAAGPVAGLLLGLFCALLLGLQIGDISAGVSYYLYSPFGLDSSIPTEHLHALISAVQNGALPLWLLGIYSSLLFVSMWWSIFNLLPILPLDGGQLLRAFTGNISFTALIGLGLSAVLAIVSAIVGMWWSMMLLGYFAYINWLIFRARD